MRPAKSHIPAFVGILALSATGAAAADLGVVPLAAPAPLVFDWTGAYFGGHVGYGWTGASGVYDADDSDLTDLSPLDPEGAGFGLQIGYNQQIGSVVVGIEADTTWFDAADRLAGSEPPPRGPDDLVLDPESVTSVRGRLGWTRGNYLVFGTAGYGWSDVDFIHTNALNSTVGRDDLDGEGAVYGGGIELALSDFTSFRAEYLHYDVGATDGNLSTGNTDVSGADFITVDDIDVVRATLNIRFCGIAAC